MSDGVELLTDRYHPRGGESLPVILIRSPYGRTHQYRNLALVLAERGFQVLLQSCRGTDGSDASLPTAARPTSATAISAFARNGPAY